MTMPSKVTSWTVSPGSKSRASKATSISRRNSNALDWLDRVSVVVLVSVPTTLWKYPSLLTSNFSVTGLAQVVSYSVQRSMLGVRVTRAGMGSKAE